MMWVTCWGEGEGDVVGMTGVGMGTPGILSSQAPRGEVPKEEEEEEGEEEEEERW
jgi:hypothetical protein